MTRCEFFTEDDRITGFSVSGHSGYSEAGSDIVCAGVSAISFALIGYLQQRETEAQISGGTGSLAIDCRGDERAASAFDMALCGWLQIAANYPHHVEVYIATEGG